MNADFGSILDALAKLLSEAMDERESARQQIEAAVQRIVDTHIEADGLDEALVIRTLKALRDAREFDHLFEVASHVVDLVDDPQARLFRAQAAIELKEFSVATLEIYGLLDVYAERSLRTDIPEQELKTARKTYDEAKSLFGRLNKQQYVDAVINSADRRSRASRDAYLLAAIESYAAPLRRSLLERGHNKNWFMDAYYPGVNVVALLRRAERDGVPSNRVARRLAPELQLTSTDLARLILEPLVPFAREQLLGVKDPDYWSIGTVGELLLAIEQSEAAAKGWGTPEEWFGLYLDTVNQTSFALAGTIRQLEEVWLVRQTDLPYRARALTRLKGASATRRHEFCLAPVSQDKVGEDEGNYEKIVGGHRLTTYQWTDRFRAVCQSIGRVRRYSTTPHDRRLYDGARPPPVAETLGTGFLFDGSVLGLPLYKDVKLFLTNAHVMSDLPIELNKGALAPHLAEIEFGAPYVADCYRSADERTIFVQPALLWTSPRHELDATILRVDDPRLATVPTLQIADPTTPHATFTQAHVIGYPNNGDIAFQKNNNDVREFGWRHQRSPDHLFVHYKASTEPGMSGSPVLTPDLDVVFALHHYGPEDDDLDGRPERRTKRQQIRRLNVPASNSTAPTWPANQGVMLSSILRRASLDLAIAPQRNLGAAPPLQVDSPAPKRSKLFGWRQPK